MPNFDSFERLLKKSMIELELIESIAKEISSLPDLRKPRAFKYKNSSEIEKYLSRAKKKLDSYFGPTPAYSSNENNQLGKDLFEIKSKTEIELKSGPDMTDANSGLNTISWALNIDENELRDLMNAGRLERQQYLERNINASTFVNTSKAKSVKDFRDFIESKLTPNKHYSKLEHFFRSVSVGLTKYDEIIGSYENAITKFPLMLEADWEGGWKEYSKAFAQNEKLIYKGVSSGEDRCQINVVGEHSSRKGVIYPHYRNSWRSSRAERTFPASNWVCSPSFQVWIN
jgi:hypothetical protein